MPANLGISYQHLLPSGISACSESNLTSATFAAVESADFATFNLSTSGLVLGETVLTSASILEQLNVSLSGLQLIGFSFSLENDLDVDPNTTLAIYAVSIAGSISPPLLSALNFNGLSQYPAVFTSSTFRHATLIPILCDMTQAACPVTSVADLSATVLSISFSFIPRNTSNQCVSNSSDVNLCNPVTGVMPFSSTSAFAVIDLWSDSRDAFNLVRTEIRYDAAADNSDLDAPAAQWTQFDPFQSLIVASAIWTQGMPFCKLSLARMPIQVRLTTATNPNAISYSIQAQLQPQLPGVVFPLLSLVTSSSMSTIFPPFSPNVFQYEMRYFLSKVSSTCVHVEFDLRFIVMEGSTLLRAFGNGTLEPLALQSSTSSSILALNQTLPLSIVLGSSTTPFIPPLTMLLRGPQGVDIGYRISFDFRFDGVDFPNPCYADETLVSIGDCMDKCSCSLQLLPAIPMEHQMAQQLLASVIINRTEETRLTDALNFTICLYQLLPLSSISKLDLNTTALWDSVVPVSPHCSHQLDRLLLLREVQIIANTVNRDYNWSSASTQSPASSYLPLITIDSQVVIGSPLCEAMFTTPISIASEVELGSNTSELQLVFTVLFPLSPFEGRDWPIACGLLLGCSPTRFSLLPSTHAGEITLFVHAYSADESSNSYQSPEMLAATFLSLFAEANDSTSSTDAGSFRQNALQLSPLWQVLNRTQPIRLVSQTSSSNAQQSVVWLLFLLPLFALLISAVLRPWHSRLWTLLPHCASRITLFTLQAVLVTQLWTESVWSSALRVVSCLVIVMMHALGLKLLSQSTRTVQTLGCRILLLLDPHTLSFLPQERAKQEEAQSQQSKYLVVSELYDRWWAGGIRSRLLLTSSIVVWPLLNIVLSSATIKPDSPSRILLILDICFNVGLLSWNAYVYLVARRVARNTPVIPLQPSVKVEQADNMRAAIIDVQPRSSSQVQSVADDASVISVRPSSMHWSVHEEFGESPDAGVLSVGGSNTYKMPALITAAAAVAEDQIPVPITSVEQSSLPPLPSTSNRIILQPLKKFTIRIKKRPQELLDGAAASAGVTFPIAAPLSTLPSLEPLDVHVVSASRSGVRVTPTPLGSALREPSNSHPFAPSEDVLSLPGQEGGSDLDDESDLSNDEDEKLL